MPQLHLYVSREIAEALVQKAKAQNMSVSRYLAELVRREVGPSWPSGYEQLLGGWRGSLPQQTPEAKTERPDLDLLA